jgi:hypothetical protein
MQSGMMFPDRLLESVPRNEINRLAVVVHHDVDDSGLRAAEPVASPNAAILLPMYDKDYFMLPNSPNGRTNIRTVSLDANELKFADDGSLTVTISRQQPADAVARANWLPAPEGQSALIVRAYVPTQPVLDGSYKLERAGGG